VQVSKAKPIDELSESHVLALFTFATRRGRSWKTQLLAAWESCGANAPDYTPELQQIRNFHGPQLLTKLRTCDVLEAGAQVAARSGTERQTDSLSADPSP